MGVRSPSSLRAGALSPADYLREARVLLAKGKRREAYELLQPALVRHAGDPFLLSYCGFLAAFLDGKYRYGIESCERAILLFEKISLRGEGGIEEKLYAVLYLNLGRAYYAAGDRKKAFEAMQKGIRSDRQNQELQDELVVFGVRKYVPLPFLNRSNPINVLVGKMLRKTRHQTVAQER